jgi:hypothetical protein
LLGAKGHRRDEESRQTSKEQNQAGVGREDFLLIFSDLLWQGAWWKGWNQGADSLTPQCSLKNGEHYNTGSCGWFSRRKVLMKV